MEAGAFLSLLVILQALARGTVTGEGEREKAEGNMPFVLNPLARVFKKEKSLQPVPLYKPRSNLAVSKKENDSVNQGRLCRNRTTLVELGKGPGRWLSFPDHQAWWPELDPRNLNGGRRKPTRANCSPTSIHAPVVYT